MSDTPDIVLDMTSARALTHEPGATSSAVPALSSIRAWWSARVALAGMEPETLPLEVALEAQPPLPLAELSEPADSADPWELGSRYVGALDATERATHGRHYTPRDLAEHLWAMTREALGFGVDPRPLPGLLRDPAVGAGALLVAPLREHLRASADVDPLMVLNALPNVLEGIDNDPWAVYVANVVLAAEMLPTLARVPAAIRRPLPALARVGDGLDPNLAPAHSWIMNPPYGRQRLTAERRAQFAETLYGHANLYGLFLASTLGRTAADGAVGALVPTSFSAGLYFTRLRAAMGKQAPLRSLMFVHERDGVFGGVLQETCLAVFTPRAARRTTVTRVNGHVSAVAKVPVPRHGDPWLIPRESRDAPTAAAAASLPLTLRDLGWRASTGPLVWNRRRSDLHRRPAKNRARIVWAADLERGRVRRARARDAYRYLALTKPSDGDVMALRTPAVLVQRTTAPEQERRLVVAQLTADDLAAHGGAVVVENHVNVLRPTGADPLITAETLARVLATPTFDRLMRCISGSVAVSAYELESLPFPDADVVQHWNTAEDLDAAVEAAYRTVPSA